MNKEQKINKIKERASNARKILDEMNTLAERGIAVIDKPFNEWNTSKIGKDGPSVQQVREMLVGIILTEKSEIQLTELEP